MHSHTHKPFQSYNCSSSHLPSTIRSRQSNLLVDRPLLFNLPPSLQQYQASHPRGGTTHVQNSPTLPRRNGYSCERLQAVRKIHTGEGTLGTLLYQYVQNSEPESQNADPLPKGVTTLFRRHALLSQSQEQQDCRKAELHFLDGSPS